MVPRSRVDAEWCLVHAGLLLTAPVRWPIKLFRALAEESLLRFSSPLCTLSARLYGVSLKTLNVHVLRNLSPP